MTHMNVVRFIVKPDRINDYFIKLILQMDIYKKRKEFLKVQKSTKNGGKIS